MQNNFICLSCAAISSMFLFSATNSLAADYYKWVDAKGTTHYTKTPPPASAKKKTKVETYGWNNSAPAQSAAGKTGSEAPAHTAQNTEAPENPAQSNNAQGAGPEVKPE